jgi:hypothetical protein
MRVHACVFVCARGGVRACTCVRLSSGVCGSAEHAHSKRGGARHDWRSRRFKRVCACSADAGGLARACADAHLHVRAHDDIIFQYTTAIPDA